MTAASARLVEGLELHLYVVEFLARALGFRDAFRLMESIPDAEKGYTTACTPGGEQRIGYVTEAGFYRALGQRQAARIGDAALRERVERFQSWVLHACQLGKDEDRATVREVRQVRTLPPG